MYVADEISKSLSKPTDQDLLDSMELRTNVDVYTTVCVRLPLLCTGNITSSAALGPSRATRDDPDAREETFETPDRYLREDEIEDEALAPESATKLVPRCYSTFYYTILNGVHIHQRLATQHVAHIHVLCALIACTFIFFFARPETKFCTVSARFLFLFLIPTTRFKRLPN